MKTCVICKKEFFGSKCSWNRERQLCCSAECKKVHRSERDKKRVEARRKFSECRKCGKTFGVTVHNKVYCSQACRIDDLSKMKCLACGELFRRTKSNMYYCTESCKKNSFHWQNVNRKRKVGLIAKCLNCQKTYEITNNTQKFCCTNCQQQFSRRKRGILALEALEKRDCALCSKPFKPQKKNAIYCSENCRDYVKLQQRREHYKALQAKKKALQKPKFEVICGLVGCETRFIPKTKEHKFCCKKHLQAHYRLSAEKEVIKRGKKALPKCSECGVQLKSHFKKFCEKCFFIRRAKVKKGYVPLTEVESCFDANSGDFYRSPWAVIGDRCHLDRDPTELDPKNSDYADEIQAFLKKGGKIKKLPVGFCASPIMMNGSGVN